jgi:hypothetical protein
MVYEWKVPKYPVPAQSAGEELERIERKYGVVTPGKLLEESRTAGAVLHGLFQWDDTRAAEEYRLIQAQRIISNIVVVKLLDQAPQEPVRAFVNILSKERERGYVSIVKVLSDAEQTRYMLETALKEFLALRDKYRALSELAELFAVIDRLERAYAPRP